MADRKATNDPWTPLPPSNSDNEPTASASHASFSAEESDRFKRPLNPNTKLSYSAGFEDVFVPPQSLIQSNKNSLSLQNLPDDPLYNFIDSERYIQSLEKKLAMITKGKGKKAGPTSKDIISSLACFHEDQMKSYIDSNDVDSSAPSRCVEQELSSSLLYRKLYPEKQALSAEELLALVLEDTLDLNSEQSSADSEKSNAESHGD